MQITGTLRLPTPESQPHQKVFRGVLIETTAGAWVVSYTRDDLWAVFADRRVAVVGTRYEPEGQALVGPHLRVKSLRLAADEQPDLPFVKMGEELEIDGRFERWTWPAGTKLAGETTTRFRPARGEPLFLARPEQDVPLDVSVTVRGRLVEPSNFYAGVGGEHLWVYGVHPTK